MPEKLSDNALQNKIARLERELQAAGDRGRVLMALLRDCTHPARGVVASPAVWSALLAKLETFFPMLATGKLTDVRVKAQWSELWKQYQQMIQEAKGGGERDTTEDAE